MSGFPPLPSGNNPALGAASSFANSAASAYSAGLQFASAMRAATAQNEARLAAQRKEALKDQFETELKMRDKGYSPYTSPRTLNDNPSTGDRAGGSVPTLMSGGGDPARFSRQDDVDPSQLVKDHFGRQWVAPPKKPDVTPQQAATDLRTALKEGGQPVSPEGNVWQNTTTPRLRMDEQGNVTDTGATGVHVPVPDQGRVLPSVGGNPAIYMPTGEERAATKLQEDIRAEGAKSAAASTTLPDSLAEALEKHAGLPGGSLHGVKIPKEAIAGTFGKALTPEKPEKPDKYVYTHFTDDAGRVTHTRIGEDSIPQVWNGKTWDTAPASAAIGPKRKDPDAPTQPPRPTAQQLRSVSDRKYAGLRKAEADFRKALQNAITPEDKQNALQDLSSAKQAAQDEYEQGLGTLLGKDVGHFSYSDQADSAPGPQGAQPSGQPQQPATGGGRGAPQQSQQQAAGQQPKAVTLQQLNSYVTEQQKSNPRFTKADAIREAKGRGYTITGQ